MIHKIYMPKFGANIEEGIIVEWLKEEGEEIHKGDILAQIETSKSVFDLEAEESGILRKILAEAGEEISFNQVIALVGDESEVIEPILKEIEDQKIDRSADFVQRMDESVFIPVEKALSVKKKKFTPSARRVMRESGLDEDIFLAVEKDVIDEEDVQKQLMAEQVFIYGASTGAKQIFDILKTDNQYRVVGIIDDNEEFLNENIYGVKVVGNFEWLKKRYEEKADFGVMIASHSRNREKIYKRIKESMPDIKFPPIIDQRAVLLTGVEVGESSLIEAGVILGHEVQIKENVILNLGVKISHNCIIGAHSHIAIGASISAAVTLDGNNFIGAGVAINPAVSIGENTLVSPNSAVLNDIPANVVINGVPGKVVGESKRGQ